MAADQGERLLGLGVVIVVAVGSVLFLLNLGGRSDGRRGGMLPGYPPDLFPARDITRSGPLAALAATQARLLSMYRQTPPASDSAVWLWTFLVELREIMDTAYRVAVVDGIYGQSGLLDRLVVEVQQIEAQVAAHVAQRLLARDGDAQNELLSGRLATLRMCVRELASFAEMRGPPAS